jgi:peroxiredoxin
MEVGARPPDLSFTTLMGKELRLSAFRGAPVVLTFLRYIG